MLQTLDLTLFQFINDGCSHPFWDAVLPWWRDKLTWIPLYVFLLVFLAWQYRSGVLLLGLALGLTLGATDQISSQLIKKTVQRPRPCRALPANSVHVRVACGGGYSFPSSHAANHLALATFLWGVMPLLARRRSVKVLLFAWAISIGIAQIYVGVHYPSDVLAGALLGWGLARLGLYGYNRFN